MKPGKVYLVGAGPGDPGLITVRALESLSLADVIVYDDLVGSLLLNYARPEAECIYAGKRRGSHIIEQEKINALLLEKAAKGKTVVRLKGGDPFVLARGGEEAEFLREHKIPFEIIPGISSAIAVPAYAGIPVTHRHLASSFTVITGHERSGANGSAIDWKNLAEGSGTLIFLMGMHNLADIIERLLGHGKKGSTPAAVITEGTLPAQKAVTGRLDNIVKLVEAAGLKSPGIIVIGEVVSLREKLNWFNPPPLAGKRILITRPEDTSGNFQKLLFEAGAVPLAYPAIEIRDVLNKSQINKTINHLSQYDWIIFTSANGVAAFFARLAMAYKDARALGKATVAAIGPATAAAIEAQGIRPDFVPEDYSVAGILKSLEFHTLEGRKVLLPRSNIADDELRNGLLARGAKVEELAVYRTVTPRDGTKLRSILGSGGIDVITFTSASAANSVAAKLKGNLSLLDGVKIACIGEKTAQAVTKAGLKADIVAPTHTLPGLVIAMEKYFREAE